MTITYLAQRRQDMAYFGSGWAAFYPAAAVPSLGQCLSLLEWFRHGSCSRSWSYYLLPKSRRAVHVCIRIRRGQKAQV